MRDLNFVVEGPHVLARLAGVVLATWTGRLWTAIAEIEMVIPSGQSA
ncbi:hypothetical protein IVA87_26915 [Bradyrhizobium sp. 147]|nr:MULTISPECIES: hypothetical protein [unclassified Bradyrhizobium]MCK1541104.1 hypothetical protein [Bradyrhizobium sp. 179]MCK1624703.1 hypothetical protein [Bradyrhizobium sp. 160]MCK1682932.1 hypothetical protein [Bradyrhizobium sp. 147]